MKKLHKDYWGQITVLFLFGLSLSNFTETLKMVFINRLDLIWLKIKEWKFTIFFLRDKNLKLNCWVEMKQHLSYTRVYLLWWSPHSTVTVKLKPCYANTRLFAWISGRLSACGGHVCGGVSGCVQGCGCLLESSSTTFHVTQPTGRVSQVKWRHCSGLV